MKSFFSKTVCAGYHREKLAGVVQHAMKIYRTSSASSLQNQKQNQSDLSLHISPCGDWWLGSEIYAAKHNPSGYVRSIKLPDHFEENENSLENLPISSFQTMYDTGVLDSCIAPSPIKQDSENNEAECATTKKIDNLQQAARLISTIIS